MSLSRPEREQARQIVQRALDAQAVVDAARTAVDEARLKVDRAAREHADAMQAVREWSTVNAYLPTINGAVVTISDGRILLRPIQSIDEPAPAPAPAVEPVRPPEPVPVARPKLEPRRRGN